MFAHQKPLMHGKRLGLATLLLFFRILGEHVGYQRDLVAGVERRLFAARQRLELRTSQLCAIHHA
jgi:hypothetical protein